MRFLIAFLSILLALTTLAEAATTITADSLEHFEKEDKYVALGKVRIERNGAVVTADKGILYNRTGDAELEGNVVYEDQTAMMNSEKAKLNLDKNTGEMQNAIIYIKERKYQDLSRKQALTPILASMAASANTASTVASTNASGQTMIAELQRQTIHYWIYGENISKLAEDRYHAQRASITSCDSEPCLSPGVIQKQRYLGAPREVAESASPSWAFHGRDVSITVGEKMTAQHVTLRVKDTPVFYAPYFYAPVRERQTGLLIPTVGTSSMKGFIYKQPFFWAIDDNKDATVDVDYFSKLGVGTGLQYRYLDFDGKGQWSVYHLRDKEVRKDYLEIKGQSDYRPTTDIRGFADVNYVNGNDYYRRYGSNTVASSERFLQSSAELSAHAWADNRVYLLGQYWIDLHQDQNAKEPQKLPEIGYFMKPIPLGPLTLSMQSSLANFVRPSDPSGQRLDIMPTLTYSTGDTIRLTQQLSLRETAYWLRNPGTYRATEHRESLEYRAYAFSRFIKTHDDFTHILEPFVEYRFIPKTRNLPQFDSVESFNRTSLVQVGMLNNFTFKAFNAFLKATQPIDMDPQPGTHAVQPTAVALSVFGKGVGVQFDTSHDFSRGRTESANTAAWLEVFNQTRLIVGERYSRTDNIMLYTMGFDSRYWQNWFFSGTLGYDMKQASKLRDVQLVATRMQQCWAVSTTLTRKPGDGVTPSDISFMLLFELKGIGVLKLL
ncbi:MAG TPA: LPS assembly protein LptD [Dissulfurispiraceae bacterium]|nr:LPS assembly protein LptD [Dissulfurispiraceae bacterium]